MNSLFDLRPAERNYKDFFLTTGYSTLEHAIDIMGIDSVGIGTDFDGDGTVSGCADASELINFTKHLLLRHYSERDIEKIWGGNWIRVMAQVQAAKKQ